MFTGIAVSQIVHRNIHQPKSGRRRNDGRRCHDVSFHPERRSGQDRRAVPDRRQANL